MSNLSFKLSADSQDFTKELENAKASVGNVKKEMRSLTQETNTLETAYRRLTNQEKNSPFGRYLRQEIDKNIAQLADMKDTIDDVQQQVSKLASDTAVWEGMAEAISVSKDVVSAFATSLGISTKEGTLAADAINMLTRAQTAANAVISVGNALQKTSKIMGAITTLQLRAQAAATNQCTIAQKAFNMVAKANPYVLLISAIVALVGALTLFSSGTDEAAKEQERLQKEMEETKKKAQEEAQIRQSAGQSYIDSAEKLRTLKAAYEASNNQLSKTEIIKEAAAEFKKLGINVNSTNEAQKILVQNGDKLIEMLRLQADAAAINALRMEMLKNKMKDIMTLSGANISEAYGRATYMLKSQLADADKKAESLKVKAMTIQQQLKSSGVNFGSGKSGSKSSKQDEPLAGSLEALRNEYSKYKQQVEKGIRIKPRLGSFMKDFEAYEKRIKEKEIQLGLKMPDPKDIPFTEAWYNEEIKKLENKKAMLPLDAYIDREKLQDQIDEMKFKIKLETDGVVITGSQSLADALTGNINNSINGVGGAISALQDKLMNSDLKNLVKTYAMNEAGDIISSNGLDDYLDKIVAYKMQLEELQNKWKELEPAMLTPMEKAQKKLEQTQQTINSVGNAISAAGELFSELGKATDDEGLQVMGIVAKAVATVALSYAQALASTKTWVDWLAFGISGLATMVSMISSIRSATGGFAEGGVVGGNSTYGDRLFARVNSGEVILNQKQQQRAWELMDNGFGGANVNVSGVIRGRDLVLVASNESKYASRSGRNISF